MLHINLVYYNTKFLIGLSHEVTPSEPICAEDSYSRNEYEREKRLGK